MSIRAQTPASHRYSSRAYALRLNWSRLVQVQLYMQDRLYIWTPMETILHSRPQPVPSGLPPPLRLPPLLIASALGELLPCPCALPVRPMPIARPVNPSPPLPSPGPPGALAPCSPHGADACIRLHSSLSRSSSASRSLSSASCACMRRMAASPSSAKVEPHMQPCLSAGLAIIASMSCLEPHLLSVSSVNGVHGMSCKVLPREKGQCAMGQEKS